MLVMFSHHWVGVAARGTAHSGTEAGGAGVGAAVGIGVGVAFGFGVGATMAVGAGPNEGSEGRERPLTTIAPNRTAPARTGAQFRVRRATAPRMPRTPRDATTAASPPRVTVPVV